MNKEKQAGVMNIKRYRGREKDGMREHKKVI